MDRVEDLLKGILRAIVDYPEDVQVHATEISDEKGELVMLNVKVHKDDVGACIGSGGKTAEAIRRVIALVGFKQLDQRVYVKVDAPKIPKTYFDYDEQFNEMGSEQ